MLFKSFPPEKQPWAFPGIPSRIRLDSGTSKEPPVVRL